MTRKWYVVHTYSGQENKVKAHLEMMIEKEQLDHLFGEILVPTHEVVSHVNGKKKYQDKKHFPSYIIIEMELTKESQHFVTDIPGVTHFVGVGKPQPLRDAEVQRILGTTDKESNQNSEVECPYVTGDKVKIKDGPFKDFDGAVEEVDLEKGKVKVLVSVFGRSTPVELDFFQIESIT